MRVKGATVQRLMLGAALMAALAWNLSHAAEVEAVRLTTGATGTRAEIALDAPGEFKTIRLHSPERLAIDLPASRLSKALKLPAGNGVIGAVRSGQPAPGAVRIVFDLAQPVAAVPPRLEQAAGGARIVIEWPGDGQPPASSATSAAPVVTKAAPKSADPARASADATSRLIAQMKAATAPASTASAGPTAPSPAATAVAAGTSGSASNGAVAPSSGPAAPVAEVAAASTRAPVAAAPHAAGPGTSVTAASKAAPVASSNSIVAKVPPAPVTAAAPPVLKPAPTDATPASAAMQPRIAPGVPTHTVEPTAAEPAPADRAPLPATGSRSLRPLVIAIDPGHGGQDPGALGPSGSREKDVTLAIARELARQINATPGLKAYLTRDSDMFLPLPRRAQLAKQARADMFVSIHADAAENRAARGSSVFVLSLKGASSQRARWLADKENASDIIGGVRMEKGNGTLASVLLDLTQSGHMRASEDAAAHVLAGLRKLGPNHKPHVERANFAVLRTSDMPSMLVETAFISNPEEEQRLIEPSHQRALARAVLDGINTYFTRQPPPGTMYAARAEAQVGASGGSP